VAAQRQPRRARRRGRAVDGDDQAVQLAPLRLLAGVLRVGTQRREVVAHEPRGQPEPGGERGGPLQHRPLIARDAAHPHQLGGGLRDRRVVEERDVH
jgi:hypothetical protein